MISQLVRYAQGSIAVHTIWQGLAEHRWNDAQLAALQNQFAQINYLPGLEQAFEGERACGIRAFDGWISSPATGLVIGNADGSPSRLPVGYLSRGILRQNEIALVRFHQRMIDGIRLASSNSPAVGLIVMVQNALKITNDAQRELNRHSPYELIAAMTAPALGKSVQKAARYQTTVKMAAVACALERYRLKHGGFPEKLDDLAPEFLSATPLDPMNNQPFHYHRTDDGWFLLYSVGLNGHDDGGQFTTSADGKGEELDWPWPVPSRPERRNIF